MFFLTLTPLLARPLAWAALHWLSLSLELLLFDMIFGLGFEREFY